jgi:hypothetical protein
MPEVDADGLLVLRSRSHASTPTPVKEKGPSSSLSITEPVGAPAHAYPLASQMDLGVGSLRRSSQNGFTWEITTAGPYRWHHTSRF